LWRNFSYCAAIKEGLKKTARKDKMAQTIFEITA